MGVTVTAHKNFGFNITLLDLSSLYYASNATWTSTLYRLYYSDGSITELRGSGFKYDSYGIPTAGTVSSYAEFYNGTRIITIDGAKIKATAIVKAAGTYGTNDDQAVVYGALTGNDTFKGGDGQDVFSAYSGNDTLIGNGGNDTLDGWTGNDKLTGGAGSDFLYGGTGSDTFIYKSTKDSTVAASGRDTIWDFSRAQKDKIDLSAIDASTKSAGNQAFSFIGTKAFSGKAGELRYDKQASDTYVYADVNGDKKADFAIHFDDPISFQKGDFFL